MRATLTRTDAILRPKMVEERRNRIESMRENRDKTMAEIMPRLFKNEDFKRFLECAIWRVNLFAHEVELSPFFQGKRVAISEFIQWSMTHGGEEAIAFYGDVARKHAAYRQQLFKGEVEA